MSNNIELVLFDCDGVLVDTELLANRVFIQEVRKFGFHLSEEEAWEHFPGSRFASCVAYVESTNGKNMPADFVEIYKTKIAEIFAAEITAIPGIENVLAQMQLPKVVTSNGPRQTIITNLTTCHLMQYFHLDHIFSAYDIQKWKPDPDLHLAASTYMKTPPAHCLVVEDSVPGAQAALAAGMQVVGFTHHGRNQKIIAMDIPKIDYMEDLLDFISTPTAVVQRTTSP